MTALVWAITILILVSDQASKLLITRLLAVKKSIEVIPNIFSLSLVQNTGAAFGIFKSQTVFFIIVSILAAVGIIIYIKKNKEKHVLEDIALSLVLGGALGNLIDRLRFGYVVDFLDFKIWPVFNLADSAVTVGVVLIFLRCIRYYSK